MRPPIPSVTLSRRARIALWTIAAVVVLIIVLVQLSGVYLNWLWFDSVHFKGVYSTIFWTRVSLFLIFGAAMSLVIGGNLVLAYLLSPPFRPMSPEQQNIERYRASLEPRRILVLLLISGFAFLTAGLSAQGNWQIWQLWLHGPSFHQTDPQFGKDISFYAWDYPVYRALLGFGFTAIVFAFLLSLVVHYLSGAIRLQTPGPKVTIAARRHLTLLAFVFVLLKALAYWLDRYGLVFSGRGPFTGASYTDVHAVLPARTILFWVALVIAAGLLASLWLRSTLLPSIAFVSMLVMSILISGIYPAVLQQVSVKPNASSKEAPYIKRNIDATRQAYGIVTGQDVAYQSYPSVNSPSLSSVTTADPTVADIRILDPNVLSRTFTQLQQVRQYYGFAPKLDVDRYGTRDYIVGVRELDASNLTGDQTNWINEHTVYTHGYGFVAAAANTDVTNRPSAFTEKNIKGKEGPLGLTQPEVYFGELLPDYSIVGAQGAAQEFNARGGAKVTYQGDGGLSLKSFFTRLAFAVNYKQTNFLLNDAATAPGAQIISNRDPRQRVEKVAPWLTVDSDPYPVVDSSTGHIVWMVDGYTTMDNFPYSQRNSLADLTSDSLSTTGKTAAQPNDSINYIRNSVKATVDAYTGKVTLYAWDPSDPVLQAWERVFPGAVQPKSAMPTALQAHVRYPEDIFEAQRALLATYHVSDPVKFYNVSDKWSVPNDPNDPAAKQPPYYVLAAPPGTDDAQPQFQLTSPMTVNGKNNLAAYISVDSDAGASGPTSDYGKMTVLRVPSGRVTAGPEQVANKINSTPRISTEISYFNNAGGGSSVVYGNLLTLPLGDSFLYVEPIYLQKSTTSGSYPTLVRVAIVYGGGGNLIGYDETLAGALKDLGPPDSVGQYITNSVSGSGAQPKGSPSSTGAPTPSPSRGAVSQQQLQTLYDRMRQAFANGDFARGNQLEGQLLTELGGYLGQSGTSGTPSATPSGGGAGATSSVPAGSSAPTSAPAGGGSSGTASPSSSP